MLAKSVMAAAAALVVAGTGWSQWTATEEAKLTASDAAAYDCVGWAVAASGDTAVVGAWFDDHHDSFDAGSAYVFVRSGTSWVEQQKLTASDATAFDYFGESVAVEGDTLVVGASYVDGPEGALDVGSAYVFAWNGTTWSEQQKLTASDAAANDYFGIDVAVSGDTIVVGAYSDNHAGGSTAGSAYVFARSGTSWIEQQKLTASDASPLDLFGLSVAISGATAAVGALGDDHADDSDAGSAYVFVRNGTHWTEQAKLTASDAAAEDSFGGSVAASGDTVTVGAGGDDHAGGTDAGSAYVFVRSGTTWNEQAKLIASDAAAEDWFGSVSVSGETAVVGAFGDDHAGGVDAGSAYVFVRSGTDWTEQMKLVASDASDFDSFGTSSLSDDTVVVGAWKNFNPGVTYTGAAYAFRLSLESPVTYCTSGTSASGCQALLSATGTASATAASGFVVLTTGVEGQKVGLLFFGTNGQQANSWGNGTSYQCVVPPVVRCGLLTGSGTTGLCDGVFSQDLNALWCSACPKPQKNPGAAVVVQAQLWYRDPFSTSNQTTSLSDAIEFVVGL